MKLLTPDNIVYIDFETFYGTDYSLRKMSTSSYVRDARFKTHGVGVALGDGKPVWLTGQNVNTFFATVDWSQYDVCGHNLVFDGQIMTERYNAHPRSWVDTLGMARAIIGARVKSLGLDALGKALGLGGKRGGGKALADVKDVLNPTQEQLDELGRYCAGEGGDIELTRKLFKLLAPAFPAVEYDLLSWTIEMAVQPRILIDPAPLAELAVEEKNHKQELVKQTGLKQSQISSNPQFAELLESLGVTPPKKISKTTGKETFAFAKDDEEFIDLLEHDDDAVVDLVEARLAVKSTIKETRSRQMTTMAAEGPWALQLNYSGAMQTQRLSGGGGVNPQNLPRNQKDKPSLLRKALCAAAGRKFVVIDLSQIELRVNCAVSGQYDVLNRLIRGEDEYAHFASIIYGRPIDPDKDKFERNVGKVGVLSLGYGASAKAFRKMLRAYGIRMSLAVCAEIVRAYRSTYMYIKASWDVYDGWLRTFAHGSVPIMPAPIQAPITMKSDGFILPRGLHVSYPNLCRYDFANNKVVNLSDNVYMDGQANASGATYADDRDVNYAYTNMRKTSGFANIYGSKVCGNLCQSLARDVNMHYVQLLRAALPNVDRTARVVMSVHDESVIECAEDRAEDVLSLGLGIMTTPPDWWPTLPVAAEGSIGQNYAEAK